MLPLLRVGGAMDLSTIPRPSRSTYKIIVTVRRFFSCPDGKPKTYCSISPFSFYVDKSTYSLVKLVDCIGEKVLWGSKQYVSLWRSLPDAYVEIRTDEHLLEWLHMHKESGVVHITAQINDLSAWQVCGKPCDHALAFIGYIREADMNDYIHEYFSVERFKKAYAGHFPPMTFKHQWTKVDIGYTIKKPKLRRKPERPRKQRIKGSEEGGSTSKRKKCTDCNETGHTAKYCQGGPTAEQQKKRKHSSTQPEEASNDASTEQHPAPPTSSTTNSTQASEPAGMPTSGRARGRGRGRGRGTGGLAYWFGA